MAAIWGHPAKPAGARVGRSMGPIVAAFKESAGSDPMLLAAVAIEGYVVLAVELLAIRQLTPYVGNATDTVAIVIAAVLLPLAFGYDAGGRSGLGLGDELGVRRRLTRN